MSPSRYGEYNYYSWTPLQTHIEMDLSQITNEFTTYYSGQGHGGVGAAAEIIGCEDETSF